jgi:hypothetical protein
MLCEYTWLVLMAPCCLVYGGLCFLMFCGRLAAHAYLLFHISKLLHIGVLFMVLFSDILLRCSFVVSIDVLLGMDSIA